MKTKNFVLGLAALIFAAGAAFASILTSPIEIEVVPLGEEELQCVQIDDECDDQSSQVCKVRVVLPNTQTFDVDAHRQGTNCTEVLNDSRPVINQNDPIAVEDVE